MILQNRLIIHKNISETNSRCIQFNGDFNIISHLYKTNLVKFANRQSKDVTNLKQESRQRRSHPHQTHC